MSVAVRLGFLTGLAGIVNIDMILNSLRPVLREIDFQVRTIATLVTFDYGVSETARNYSLQGVVPQVESTGIQTRSLLPQLRRRPRRGIKAASQREVKVDAISDKGIAQLDETDLFGELLLLQLQY